MTDEIAQLFRPAVQQMHGYTPGIQPQEEGWTKLNTNENPFLPSTQVVDAISREAQGLLNLYPDPLAKRFCEVAAGLFRLEPDWILPANGSDENLTILMRSFVDPGEQVASPYPSYTLYETLAEIQGATFTRLPLNPDWSWDIPQTQSMIREAKLVLIPNPNSPSGNRWSDEDILSLVPPQGVLVLDEAYGDFADHPHNAELLQSEKGKQIVITRTLSKSYSLAGIRFGFAMAHPELIEGMRKVKDSYNCNRLSLAAAAAALEDQTTMQQHTDSIRKTRSRLSEELTTLGFNVTPSQANFVWCTNPDRDHHTLYEALLEQKILVRYMKFPGAFQQDATFDGLRITIGTDEQIDRFLEGLKAILN